MGRRKLLIIVTIIIMLSLSGFLVLNVFSVDGKKRSNKGLARASSVINNSDDYTYIPPTLEYDDNNSNEDAQDMTENDSNKTPWTPATEMDLDPKSITVFVNQEFTLSKDYVPDDLIIPDVPFEIIGYDERKLMRTEAAFALEKLFAAAEKDGYILYGVSGYRSYNRQKQIFTNNIVKQGKAHTLKYSAVPGTSEHQTGLSMDVSSKSMNLKLIDAFATYPEGKWIAKNAHKYGYIVRYPETKSDVTGYAYEPWHIRYVGKDLANYLYENDLTLEEYYNYVPSPDFDYEREYAEFINYKPTPKPTPSPTPSPTPTPTPTPSPSPTPTPLPEDDAADEDDNDGGQNDEKKPVEDDTDIGNPDDVDTEDPNSSDPDSDQTPEDDSNDGQDPQDDTDASVISEGTSDHNNIKNQ